ncbi:MAG: hypothetical protein QOF86_3174 [Baekduia sp.]|nr:hypothetical protein [Baekduia sp.]MEA2283174.1 hypothetical protein [Solirubrobacteraceae bacterium]
MPDSAVLTRASIRFQTNDEDKNDQTLLDVIVAQIDGHVVARVSDFFGTFHDNHEDGPYDLELVDPKTRGEMKGGNVTLNIDPIGNDTWRFNFFLDLLFDDGAHLIARATGLELSDSQREQSFGVE